MLKGIKRYNDEQRVYIYNKVSDARDRGLDIGAVYSALANEFEVNEASIRNQYGIQSKREKGIDNIVANSGLNLIQRMKSIIRERDTHKENASIFKSQRDDIQKAYNSLKSEHDKLIKELSSLEELLN